MQALWKLTLTEAKLFLREPAAVFFTLAFPLLLLAIFGSVFGNAPSEMFGGYGSVDVSVAGYVGIMIGSLGLIGTPVTLASYREQGVLRRLRAAPVPAGLILGAQALVALMMTLVGAGLVIGAAALFFDLHGPARPWAVGPAVVLGSLSFCALGFALGGLCSTARTAQAAGMAFFFPMLFLSGAAMPLEIMPPAMRQIGAFLPLTYVVTLVKDLWIGAGWNATALGVLGALLIGGALLSIRLFRWD